MSGQSPPYPEHDLPGCRRHGINPQIYLTQLLTNLQDTPINELDRWLPDQWKTTQAAATAT